MSDTYTAPENGWVCFHCGVRFMDRKSAARHFGPRPVSVASCLLSYTELLIELRTVERELARLHEKNQDCEGNEAASVTGVETSEGSIEIRGHDVDHKRGAYRCGS